MEIRVTHESAHFIDEPKKNDIPAGRRNLDILIVEDEAIVAMVYRTLPFRILGKTGDSRELVRTVAEIMSSGYGISRLPGEMHG